MNAAAGAVDWVKTHPTSQPGQFSGGEHGSKPAGRCPDQHQTRSRNRLKPKCPCLQLVHELDDGGAVVPLIHVWQIRNYGGDACGGERSPQVPMLRARAREPVRDDRQRVDAADVGAVDVDVDWLTSEIDGLCLLREGCGLGCRQAGTQQ